MKRTPGPWIGMDAWEPIPREDLDGGEQWVSIAMIRGGPDDDVVLKPNPWGYQDFYIRKADAPVLVAAPDMLAALEAVMAWANTRDSYAELAENVMPLVEAAIKKARGE